MIDTYFNLTIFFIVSVLYFFSVIGYGKIITKKNSNFFEAYLDGTIIVLIIGFLIYITFGTNLIINIIIFCIGLILYFKVNKELKSIKNIYIILLIFLTLSILIISKTHDDFDGYHYFSIFEIFNHNLRIGVSSLNDRFFHSSNLAINQSMIILPYFDFKLVHLPVFFIYFSVLCYFIIILFSNYKIKTEIFYSLLCLLILLVKFNRLSEFGYDYICQFILLIIFHKICFYHSNFKECVKSIIYFLLCVLIKPISLLFLPIMFYVFYKTGISIFKNISLSKYLLIFSLLTIIFSSSFFKTGCFFYPINKTCFSHASISWSEKPRIKDYSTLVALWAKGFHHQDKTQYKRIEDRKIYNQNFNWIKYWIELHFFYKIFEFLLTVISLILLIYFYFKKEKKIFYEYNKDKIILCFLSFLSIIFWFITVPSFRFGFSSIIIFFYLLFNLILNLNINFDKKKFFNILVLSIIVLNLKNINRIKSEFERSDFYKFKNFPFYNEKIINNDYTNIKIEKVIHIDILKRY